ncbi:MAG: hypothetical protein M1834_002162 [Cirrosporium novae-zelandiae]|nr:MAG: hypothetical protein M1834_002162 [Cirrosporium novae-zelandiae]
MAEPAEGSYEYRPRSPDLSAFSHSQGNPSHNNFYNSSYTHRATHRASYDASPYFSPQSANGLQGYPFSTFPHPDMARRAAVKDDEGQQWAPQVTQPKPRGRGRNKQAPAVPPLPLVDSSGKTPAFAEGIEVKTKFPVARIKRIMQADEEVGKVSQVTPIAVSKALELFMISLVTKSADEARARSSKRVTAAHLKAAVAHDDAFDFLADIVARVPDAPAPNEKKQDDDDDEPTEGRKRRGGRGKRRKDSDEF